ncbi:MAG: hypothetical protein KF860_10565 [Cyclobacteriaceae bacterium]|nr:hypothetical protein [Cyclobacteriaceae bacterium]
MAPKLTYHLYTHANGFENLFRSDENYRYFLRRYDHFIPPVADTLAYCLMPNHIHLLVRIKTEEEIIKSFPQTSEVFIPRQQDLGGLNSIEKRISKQFSNLFNSYTKSFNKMYVRRGSLFIPNFKRKEITRDSYFTSVIHYIHANPVKHGFVKQITNWPWSSYHGFLLPELMPAQQEVINWFGNLQQFIQFHQQTANNIPDFSETS